MIGQDNPIKDGYLIWYKQPIVLAISLLLCLVSLISYIAYQEVTALQTDLSQAAEAPLKKIQHLDSMVHLSRQRQVLLRDLVISVDAFERDDIILEHQKQAGLYFQARSNLEKLLDGEAKKILHQIMQQNQNGYQVQVDIIDAAVNEEIELALKLLRENLGPSREVIYPLMLQLRDVLIEESINSVARSRQHAKDVNNQIIRLYIISFGCGILLIILAYRIQRKHNNELSWQTTHNELTGLINRHRFEFILSDRVKNKSTDVSCALLYIDLDQFKLVNDTAGHSAGDELLRQVSELLIKHLEPDMTLGRLGGDEFAILAPQTDKEDAVVLADNLLHVFSGFHFDWTDRTFDISISIGLVLFKGQNYSKEELFTAADLACHTAKDNGRNRYHIYTPTDLETKTRLNEMHWATKLRNVMDNNKLRLYHQPIVNISNPGSYDRTEILLRYIEDGMKPIGPLNMVNAAEKFGFANTLDEYVISMVLSYIKSNPADNTIYNVNLSGQSLVSTRTLNHIIDLIDEYDINPELLCFEITETTAITRYTDAQKFITILQGLGCRFALDDFGTGISSFGYLDKLPVDMIKIDASFVQHLHADTASRAIVIAIREVAHAFGIKVVAEGVENEDIRLQLEELGIDYAQGYGIVMPAPLDKIAA